ncbi:MAG: GtrA family protein [Defluviitaleaceae bacterium]|nr:GtrA family protein [Defluviitaleaceae bacterium]MCL2262188.1 GtrA family protein [Defluviitaleaceae bacterium]
MKKLFVQFVKFGIVGVSNTAVNLAVYYLLVAIGVHYVIASVCAFVVSVLNAFFWSRKFVFKESESSARVQLAKSYAAYGFTFLLSLGTLVLMVEVLGISEFLAPLLNLFITVPLNFLINKFWTFK